MYVLMSYNHSHKSLSTMIRRQVVHKRVPNLRTAPRSLIYSHGPSFLLSWRARKNLCILRECASLHLVLMYRNRSVVGTFALHIGVLLAKCTISNKYWLIIGSETQIATSIGYNLGLLVTNLNGTLEN